MSERININITDREETVMVQTLSQGACFIEQKKNIPSGGACVYIVLSGGSANPVRAARLTKHIGTKVVSFIDFFPSTLVRVVRITRLDAEVL